MEALRASSFPSFHRPPISTKLARTISDKPNFHIPSIQQITSPLSKIHSKKANFKVFTAISPTAAPSSTDEESSSPDQEIESEKFDWYANWYPVVPMCDLDKRRPHGKKVMGMDIVIWWDRNEDAWKVFDDSCPHRYWSHTVNCSSCSVAHKRLNVLEIVLQVFSVFAIGIVAAAKQGVISAAARYALFSAAVLCFAASKWLSHFIYKTFRYHDYDHAFR